MAIFNSRELWYILQFLVAVLLGSSIGFERKMRFKEAGIRTHAIVSGGSCLIMLVSRFGFGESADTARVASQIVSGIGFLGAGMIFFTREGIHGLTTAAGIWTTAGIGMCVGADMYTLAVGATVVMILFQCFLHAPLKIFQSKRCHSLKVKFYCQENEHEIVKAIFQVDQYVRLNIDKAEGKFACSGIIRLKEFMNDTQLKQIMQENAFIYSIQRVEEN